MRLIKLLLHSPALIILHLSLLLIIAGGVTTWLTAEDDIVALKPGEPVEVHGISLELSEFETIYYPGGEMPRNYQSHLIVNNEERTLAVNEPLTVGRWRLYQQSFTPDGCSVVALRADRPGTALTFSGYALFAIGGLFALIRKRKKKYLLFSLLSITSISSRAVPVVKPEIADSLERVQVVYQGRVVPYATVAHDALQKIYGKSSYKELSAARTVLSLTLFPEEWNSEPIIKTKAGKISLLDCFDNQGNYLMYDDVDADERVGVILLLRSGEFFSKSDEQPLSPLRVNAEIWYNRIPSTLIIFILLFIAAALSFLGWKPVLAWAALALQLAVIGVQCWLLGHGPFASTFETLQFLVAVVVIFALCVKNAQAPILLAAGCMALVAHLQHANPMVTPLMPVLHSPWLSLHVSLVMTSYAMLLVVAVMAAVGLFRNPDQMRRRALALLRPAVYLLGLGIITGSVWANEAWGRYWGWDPKETAALVTFLIYVIPLHLRKPSLWWLILPLLSVAMTYFGVNLLPSLHAYS
ncbi:MAG: cytochrome c biogenesis protein CcsA [Bacteroides sp.]|nr:cytochrome c biogenesis protein CcsA [Bacteroides sp.]MCM1378584.1 cytochrome c biogenesis protein CcsA [Bacteroides sp.]MCM1444885.1 cytochrome c biogenesis protein CcsA [Prevotella sp.]